jgi:carbon monoxide dehydrogenase subunit G
VQLENSFTVPVPIDDAWNVLLDIERIAPCMPGAALDSVDGDEFTGRVKVKLGPISLTYRGKAAFVEKDADARRAVIDARGKDLKGNGTAAAVITAKLAAQGDVTRVDVLTDLNITGRPAQFGRGVMVDVGNKLLGQFADKLAAQLASGDAGATGQAEEGAPLSTVAGTTTDSPAGAVAAAVASSPSAPPLTTTARTTAGGRAGTNTSGQPNLAADPAPIDLLGVAGGTVAVRAAAPAAAVLALLLVWLLVRRRR